MFDHAALSAVFDPRTIAIVGASSSATKIGGIPVDFLRSFGYAGEIFPVNPTAAEIQGLRAYPTIAAIGREVDLAIFAVPAERVEAALEDAIRARVKGIVLFSSGFAEVGDEGTAAQQRLSARAAEAGVRLIGPNCLGFMNIARNVYATFSPAPRVGRVGVGRIGLVSQSGAFGAYAYSMARERGVGLSLWATTGNEAGVQFADCLAWLAEDENTDVIMGYMEGCRDGPRLRAALALAQARGKPVVIVKVGTTDLGAAAAASHTAALAGDDAVYDAVFRQHGVMRAHSLTEFFDLAHAAAIAGRPRNRRIGLWTVSGGVGALMADDASMRGLDVAPLSDAGQRTLREWVPFAAPRNPVDITGQVTNDATLIERSARLMLADRDFGAWLGFFAAAGASDAFWPTLHGTVQTLRREFPQTVLAVSTLLNAERRRALEQMGCLSFDDPSQAVRAISALAGLPDPALRGSTATAPAATGSPLHLPARTLSEPEGLSVLKDAGVPVMRHAVVRDAKAAVEAARSMKGAVAMKIVSADIPHKSDAGGVALGIAGDEAVTAAYERIANAVRRARPDAKTDGLLVAPMIRGGVECIAGVHRDPVFGPVILFGLGGVHVEILRDVSLRALPITRDDARAMVTGLRSFALLDGARGAAKADVDSLADALVALADFAMRAGDTLESAEINPLIARPAEEGGCIAVDALVIGRTGSSR